jgi:TRAP-type uncharacterized transport system fused permease subunit
MGSVGKLITLLAVSLAIFQLYTAFFGLLPTMQQRSFHVAFILSMIFLLYPASKNSPRNRVPILDWILALVSAGCALYVFFGYESIALSLRLYSPLFLLFIFTLCLFWTLYAWSTSAFWAVGTTHY